MYKSRIGIWIMGLIVCLVITFIGNINVSKDEYTIYSDTSNSYLKNELPISTWTIKSKVFYSKDNADIIIQQSSNEKISGYKKYGKFLYSPIVMYANIKCQDDNSGFFTKDDTSYFDLKKLLEGLEQDKTFQDIGINKKVANGKIVIAIPDKMNDSYNEIKESFLLTLNNGNTETHDKKLNERVDNIIKKCKKVNDPIGEMKNISNNKKLHNIIFIGPEYYVESDRHESYSVFNSDNRNHNWCSIYPTKTNCIYYDVFVKNKKEKIFDKIKYKYRYCGLRTINNPKLETSYTPDTLVIYP